MDDASGVGEDERLDPLSDFGFEFLFGREETKSILLAFLNALLPVEDAVVDFEYIGTYEVGDAPPAKTVIYDLRCETRDGRRIVIEVQRSRQDFFVDRALFYLSRVLQSTTARGDVVYDIPTVYLVAILDFDTRRRPARYLRRVELKDQDGALFSTKLRMYFVELPHFTKSLTELTSALDRWLYTLRHMTQFEHIPPQELSDEEIRRALDRARIPTLTPSQRALHERLVRESRDYRAQLLTEYRHGKGEGREEGHQAGLQEGRHDALREVARNLLRTGRSVAEVAADTGLTVCEVAAVADDDSAPR